MAEALRFTTLRIGALVISVDQQTVMQLDVRVLQASDGSHRLLEAFLSEPLASVDEAVALAESRASRSGDATAELRWRDDSVTPGPDEHACPICSAPALVSPRYPRRLCPACVAEATDPGGRRLLFGNADLSGGLETKYADTGESYAGDECLVRGVRCRVQEGKFGGVVVQPSSV
jgi:hypothetical protein